MELFIRIKDGQPFEHPISKENLLQAFPNIDVNNLPSEFVRFERVEQPTLGIYEVLTSQTSTYELVDGVYKDVWHKRDMTDEEKAIVKEGVIASVKNQWQARNQAENWSAWILNEETFQYEPPISRPEKDQTKLDAGIRTFWCGAENNWKDTPPYPVDENQYKFDFIAWNWVAL